MVSDPNDRSNSSIANRFLKAPAKRIRPSIRTRATKPKTTSNPKSETADQSAPRSHLGLASSKRDKRIIKHSSFVSKIEKSSKQPRKRRRPSKRLITNLKSLADALPETGEAEESSTVVGDALIKHKSLKSRPGATKRKEKLERMERKRFGQNMAQMLQPVGVTPQQVSDNSGSGEGGSHVVDNRWSALRGFISQTLEQKPEFRETQITTKASN
ncbi:MAG: hypothetical protein M1837_007132 [Sclerophora amabilis]|nr:MAG: hypothetical protein M1837_007132 [Sclerophora amabilis]